MEKPLDQWLSFLSTIPELWPWNYSALVHAQWPSKWFSQFVDYFVYGWKRLGWETATRTQGPFSLSISPLFPSLIQPKASSCWVETDFQCCSCFMRTTFQDILYSVEKGVWAKRVKLGYALSKWLSALVWVSWRGQRCQHFTSLASFLCSP